MSSDAFSKFPSSYPASVSPWCLSRRASERVCSLSLRSDSIDERWKVGKYAQDELVNL